MRLINKISSKVLLTVTLFLSSVNVLFASNPWVPEMEANFSDDLWGFIAAILQVVILFAGLIAAGVLIFNGIMYITAAGDENKITKATKGITFAVIGLVIAGVAWLIVNFTISELIDPALTTPTGGGDASILLIDSARNVG